jgi:hypothetical protein
MNLRNKIGLILAVNLAIALGSEMSGIAAIELRLSPLPIEYPNRQCNPRVWGLSSRKNTAAQSKISTNVINQYIKVIRKPIKSRKDCQIREEIVGVGKPIVPYLIPLLQSEDKRVVIDALDVLMGMQVAAKDAIPQPPPPSTLWANMLM